MPLGIEEHCRYGSEKRAMWLQVKKKGYPNIGCLMSRIHNANMCAWTNELFGIDGHTMGLGMFTLKQVKDIAPFWVNKDTSKNCMSLEALTWNAGWQHKSISSETWGHWRSDVSIGRDDPGVSTKGSPYNWLRWVTTRFARLHDG